MAAMTEIEAYSITSLMKKKDLIRDMEGRV